MGALLKIVIGLILILVGLGLFVNSPGVMPMKAVNDIPYLGWLLNRDWLGSFITILQGFIPAFLVLVGLFMVWLEADELKMQKELEKEEKAEKKEEKPEPKKKK